MRYLFNNPIFKERRRTLRKNPTSAEHLLWRHLNQNQIQNLRFFRQYSVGPYILDFYCPKKRIAIELDGAQHREREIPDYDLERSVYLEDKSIHVLRFWNHEVEKNIASVLKIIRREIEKR